MANIADPQRLLEKLALAVSALEHKRNSRILCMVHNGRGHICEYSTLFPMIGHRGDFKKGKTIEILLHSLGGEPDAAYRLVRFLRGRYQHIHAIVPLVAKSAATLICLGMDRIFMGEFAHLGPVDIQIADPLHRGQEYFSPLDEFKSLEFLRDYAVELVDFFTGLFIERSGMSVKEALHETVPCITGILGPLYAQVDPLEMGEHRRSLDIGKEYATRLLAMTKNPNVENIVQRLVWKYPSHGFSIVQEEAKELRLPVLSMDRSEEDLLVDILMEFNRYGLSFCGFTPAQPKQKAQTSKKQPIKGVPGGKAKPVSPAAVA